MTPATKNYLGISLLGLAMIAAWTFGMPAWDRISLLNDAVIDREGILASRESILKRVEDLNKQYRERAGDIAKISSVVPSKKSVADLVSTIEATTQQSGLQLTEITTDSTVKEQEELQTLFVGLGLTGNYPSLVAFLDLLERNIRLIDVFELSASQAATPGGQVVLNFRFKANAYYIKVK